MTVIYSSSNVSAIISFNACVQALDLLLVLIKAVFPPEIAAAKTPIDNNIGKLNGEIIKEIVANLYGTVPFLSSFIDANLNLSAFGIGLNISKKGPDVSTDVILKKILTEVKSKNKKVLVVIDEARKTKELVDFADALEKACISTIESGKMTKDLALITTIENPTVLNSKDFILAIREELEKNIR